MKILIVTGCVYAENCGRNKFTGLDYVVGDIATKLGDNNAVTVFTLSPYSKNSKGKKFKIESYSYGELLRYIKPRILRRYLYLVKRRKISLKSRMKLLRILLITEKLGEVIRRNKFDIIHFNGATMELVVPSIAAIKNNVPFVYTLHGLNSFGNCASVDELDKSVEYNFLRLMGKMKMLYSVVSTGVLDRINSISELSSDKSRVILNAISNHSPKDNHYSWELLDKEKNLVLLVGTVGERKNQYQFLKALTKIDEKIRNQFQVVLLGKDEYPEGMTERYIDRLGLKGVVYKFGFASKQQLDFFYKNASFNVLISKSEGFGLSIIEAKSYGIPSLVFKSMDAVKDLYSQSSMCLIENETDDDVANGFLNMINKKWDRELIREEAKQFTIERYDEYFKLYEDVIYHFKNDVKENDIWSLI